MPNRSPKYVLVFLVLLAATGITYWARTRTPVPPNRADLMALPTQIGQWVRDGKDYDIENEALDGWRVAPRNFLMRDYVNPRGVRMSLMAVYKGHDRRGWHLSEMCFSGAGYNVTQSRTKVPYAGRMVSAVKLVARDQNTGTKEIAVYLFAQEKHTESDFVKQQMAMTLSRLRPSKYGWAFVRVTSTVADSEQETMGQIRAFFDTASGPLVRALANPPTRKPGLVRAPKCISSRQG